MATMDTDQERIKRALESDVNELASVDIDDVYGQMDQMLRERPSPLALYDRWEAQNWRVSDLDFTEDKEHWGLLMPGVKDELFRIFTQFFIGEQAVTDTLSPILLAAPDEDSRIFLATQVVDEARHTVFFKKFFGDALGIEGGLNAVLAQVKPSTVAGFQKIFDEDLVAATDRCRLDPTDRAAWVRGIAVYHFVIEGMLALTGMKFLLRVFRQLGMMPGFRAGFTAVARDESRHVNFGVGAVRRQVTERPELVAEVQDVITGILHSAVKTIEPADRPYAEQDGIEHPNDLPPPLRLNPREIYAFSINSLTKRLRVAGLGDGFCENVEQKAWGYFMAQIEGFEANFGIDHTIRYYDRGEVELV